MLFEISDSIGDAVRAGPDDVLVEALQQLAHGYRMGSHLVTGSPSTLSAIKDCVHLARVNRSDYLRMFNELPTVGGMFRKLTWKVEVVAQEGAPVLCGRDNCQVIQVSAGYIARSHIAINAVFLCENLIDIGLYEIIARTYQAISKIGKISLRFEPWSGGGQTTAQQYEAIQSAANRLCLCIVDSDLKHPTGNIGATARALQHIDDSNRPLCRQVHLNVREAENLIPTRLYSEVLYSNPAQMITVSELESIEGSHLALARHFIDLKGGIRLIDLLDDVADQEFVRYWSEVFSRMGRRIDRCWHNDVCDHATCQCLLGRLGEHILEFTLQHIPERYIPYRVAELVDGLAEPEWLRLGELITAWLCGKSAPYSA